MGRLPSRAINDSWALGPLETLRHTTPTGLPSDTETPATNYYSYNSLISNKYVVDLQIHTQRYTMRSCTHLDSLSVSLSLS